MLCHRLIKKPVVAFAAKHEAAYRHASIQFENRKAERSIMRWSMACMNGKEVVDAPLLVQNKVVVSPKGKASKTTFTSLQLYKSTA